MNIKTTPLDHLPADFDLETLRKSLTDDEVRALSEGEDPIFTHEAAPADLEPVAAAAAPVAQPAPATPATPVMPVLPDTLDTTTAKATIDAFDAKLDAIEAKFEDGDLDTIEKRDAIRALAIERAQAEALIQRAQTVEKIRTDTTQAVQATVEQQWNATLDGYQAKHPELWAQEHVGGWDAALRAVTGGPLGETLNMAECVAKAHEIYRMNYTATTGKVLAEPGATQAVDPLANLKPRTDTREPPVTLAALNGDLTQNVAASKFANIDRTRETNPLGAELLYRVMTDVEKEAYLQGAGL